MKLVVNVLELNHSRYMKFPFPQHQNSQIIDTEISYSQEFSVLWTLVQKIFYKVTVYGIFWNMPFWFSAIGESTLTQWL